MGKQTFKYIGFCLGIYLLLSAIEIFLFRPLVDFIGTSFWTYFVVYNVFLILLNPLLTKLIVNKFFVFKTDVELKNVNKMIDDNK